MDVATSGLPIKSGSISLIYLWPMGRHRYPVMILAKQRRTSDHSVEKAAAGTEREAVSMWYHLKVVAVRAMPTSEVLGSLLPFLVAFAVTITACENRNTPAESSTVDKEDDRQAQHQGIVVDSFTMKIGRGRLLSSYTVKNDGSQSLYVNAYTWMIQNGDASSNAVPDRANNIGNIIALFHNRPRGSLSESWTPPMPWVVPRLCLVAPGQCVRISFQYSLPDASVDSWLDNVRAIVLAVPYWRRLSDSLKQSVQVVVGNQDIGGFQPFRFKDSGWMFVVGSDLRETTEQSGRAIFSLLQDERVDHALFVKEDGFHSMRR